MADLEPRIAALERDVLRKSEAFGWLEANWSPDGRSLLLPGSAPVSPPVLKRSSADVTITNTAPANDVTGCTFTTPVVGTWLVLGIFDFEVSVAGVGFLVGSLSIAGGAYDQSHAALLDGSKVDRVTVPQVWVTDQVPRGGVLKLGAWKTIAAGTGKAKQGHSTMMVRGPYT